MIFALGFLAAGFLAILALPAIAGRAMRLSQRRLEMLMPLSVDEVIAERDQLRAEFAVQQRRLEQKADRYAVAEAAAKSEAGRSTIKIIELTERLKQQQTDADGLREEITALRQDFHSAQAEMATASKELHDAAGLRDQMQHMYERMRQDHAALENLAAERRTMVASLQTRVSGLEMQAEDQARAYEEINRALAERMRQVADLHNERTIAAAELAVARTNIENLSRQAEAFKARGSTMEAELSELRQAHSMLGRQATQQTSAIAGYESAIAGNAQLFTEMQDRLNQLQKRHREQEQEMNDKLDSLRQEKASVAGALEAARNGRDQLQRDISRLQQALQQRGDERELALLREAIAEIGDNVLKLRDQTKRAPKVERRSRAVTAHN
ncbi:hypothetical protein [Methylovirgula sp. 4M-Z18]|uniref:hypothetical protein n=1 Tax=Methylovirgula sp. 4M-Z18 TaxID=2293567 RepID=UPI0011C07BE8|nr:hypothetical protein [Methylovirgula sp. 4M-Z18]